MQQIGLAFLCIAVVLAAVFVGCLVVIMIASVMQVIKGMFKKDDDRRDGDGN